MSRKRKVWVKATGPEEDYELNRMPAGWKPSTARDKQGVASGRFYQIEYKKWREMVINSIINETDLTRRSLRGKSLPQLEKILKQQSYSSRLNPAHSGLKDPMNLVALAAGAFLANKYIK